MNETARFAPLIIHATYEILSGNALDAAIEICAPEDLPLEDGKRPLATTDRKTIRLQQNPLEIMLLAAGHEIGHHQKPVYASQELEEAKAFLYQFAWAQGLLITAPQETWSGIQVLDGLYQGELTLDFGTTHHNTGLAHARNYWNKSGGDYTGALQELAADHQRLENLLGRA